MSAAAPQAVVDGPVLSVRGATKRFGSVLALDGVDLEVRRGEILALLGDNGAGKSTLIKCISGLHHLDSGSIHLDGLETEIRTAVTYPDLVPAREEEGIYVYVRIADVKAPRLRHEMPMALTYSIRSLARPVEIRQRAAAAA